jgi:hypothetical protein
MMKNNLLFIVLILSLGCNFTAQKESIQKSTNKKVTENPIESPKKITADTLNLDYESRVAEFKGVLSDDFTFHKESYFLVISNLGAEETEKMISGTIVRAAGCFYNNYFSQKPTDVTVIFLFKDDKSYRSWAKKLYDDTDLSRFGYYKPGSKVMLMNISTGSGTLVHEMTHALVRYDFVNIPSWFNEGLGSLYERCSLNNNEILGYVNWRLPRLQESFTDGSYLPLAKLMKTSEDYFYDTNSDVNYAEARYLCMYMQEQGVLRDFYKQFRDNYDSDKSGIDTIEKVFGKNLSAIEKDYLAWVKTLKYE